MNKQKRLSLAVACAVLLLGAPVALAQGPAVDWWVIAGGGAPSSWTGVTLNDTIGQPVIGQATGSGDLALSAGYWVSCTAAAAVMPVVIVTREDADVVLTWDADPANAQYQVWVSTDPYFDPDDPGGVTPIVTTDATYRDIGAAASLENHFYIVRSLNACGAASVDSARKGEFTFGLTPGWGRGILRQTWGHHGLAPAGITWMTAQRGWNASPLPFPQNSPARVALFHAILCVV